ncbi:hypothetical protein AB0I66_21725 [Streptomyces sp. NPDC050439]|uniref:hypothetical protein n=1 Tax=unclassified Streptomyces TaxID=2593676 RepID=UPI0034354D1D
MSDPLRHPATEHLLGFFTSDHLPEHLAQVSRLCGDLAHRLVGELPDGPELTAALRKVLEAKDCAVRAALDAPRSDT